MTEHLVGANVVASGSDPGSRSGKTMALRDAVTLHDALLTRGRRNSLNLIRLLLAGLVIVAHAWPLSGRGATAAWFEPLASHAVPGFFCLSGFLIAHSRLNMGLGRFFWHRGLRILPAYYVVLVMVAFAAAPLSTLGGGAWRLGEAVTYVGTNAAVRQFTWNLPGTVDGMSWNGSLWTLFYELAAYTCAGLLLTLPQARRHAKTISPALLACGAAAVWSGTKQGEVTTSLLMDAGRLGTYFLAGMVMYFWSERIRVDWRLAALALGLLAGAWGAGSPDVLGPLPLAYLLLWLGVTIPPRWAQRNDISYGVYIYAFPVQVTVEWFLPDVSVFQHLCLAVLVTVPLAWGSWLLVERPAMRHKNARWRRPSSATDGATLAEAPPGRRR